MASLSHKVHSMKDAQLSRLVRMLSTDVVQTAFHQQRDLRTGDVLNHNVKKPYSDVVQINILQLKEKMVKVARFQQPSHLHLQKKLMQQLCRSTIDLVKIALTNLVLKSLALSMSSGVVQMVRRLLKVLTSKDAMKFSMRKIVVILFTDVVMMVKHQPPLLIRKNVLHALKNHLDAALMAPHLPMVIMVKDVAQFMRTDVALITSVLLVVPIMKVVIVITHLMDVAQTKKHQLVDMRMLVVVVNKLNLDAVLISSLQLQEATSKAVRATLCNLDVVQMVSPFHVDLTITDVIALKLNTSAVPMTRPQLKDPTSKDVLALKANLDVVKMVSLKLKAINSRHVLILKKCHRKPARYKSKKVIAKTTQSNTTSTTTTETATGSGTVDAEETETNSTQMKNANKHVLSMSVKKLVCYQRVLDLVTVANNDSISMLITTDAKNSSMEDAMEIPTTSRLYKSVKACALPNNLHVSIFHGSFNFMLGLPIAFWL